MAYLSVSVDLEALAPDVVEDALFDAGALAVTFTDRRDDPVLEPAPGEFRLWPSTRITATFGADDASPALIASLADSLGIAAARITVQSVEDRVWEREWLRDFHAMRFGRRLWVAPAHEPVEDADAVVVRLDPGLAFGTGTHPTTALCLEWLDAHPPEGRTVIDYGCGSGILAIAAALLGASSAHAFDIDPQALTATADNASANGVSRNVKIHPKADTLPAAADVVLANILSGPLCQLAPAFASLVAPGGRLVLAGLLETQAAEVAAAQAAWFDIAPFGQRDGWVCLAGQRK